MGKDITQEIVSDIKLVAKQLGKDDLSRSEYLQYGRFTAYQIYDEGKNWNVLCDLAGIKTLTKQAVSDHTYFMRLASAVEELGRYPKASERKKYGLNFSKRRYPTLTDFIKKAIELDHVKDLFKVKKQSPISFSNPPLEIINLIKTSLNNRFEHERPVPPIPLKSRRTRWERTGLKGFPYAPQEEQGVLALFSVLCSERILPWQILDISSGKGIDATCYDEIEKKEIQVELKYILSRANWNHPIDDLDYVVCWENRWPAFPKPVIELSKIIKET